MTSPKRCESRSQVTVNMEKKSMKSEVDDMQFYHFKVKEKPCDFGESLVIPLLLFQEDNRLTVEKLRIILHDRYRMETNSNIFYIDEDGDIVPITLNCELYDALKYATTSHIDEHAGVPLLVTKRCDSSMPDTEQHLKFNKKKNAEKVLSISTDLINSDAVCLPADLINTLKPKNVVSKEPNVSKQWYSVPPWFADYMESMKRDMVSAITREVVKHMTDILNKRLESLVLAPPNELGQSRRQLHFDKRYPRSSSDSHSGERNRKRLSAQDEGQSSDASIERVDEPQDADVMMNDLNYERIESQLRMLLKDDRFDEVMNNLDITKKHTVQSLQNIDTQEDSLRPCWFSKAKEIAHAQRIQSEALKMPDGERMNCSITGNQMLNVDFAVNNIWNDNLMNDTDTMNLCSGCFNRTDWEQEDNFVMLHIPTCEDLNSLTDPKTPAVSTEQHDSSRDSPSFELLSETSTPPPPLCINHEHFSSSSSVNEENPQSYEKNLMYNEKVPLYTCDASRSPSMKQQTQKNLINNINSLDDERNSQALSSNIIYNVKGERVGSFWRRHSDGMYSYVEDSPVREFDPSKSAHARHQTFNERKSSRDNTGNSDYEVSNSLANNLNAQDVQKEFHSRMHSQSQTDSNDFTQSFHSHTTSITDNGDVFAETHSSPAAGQTLSNHDETTVEESQEATTTTSSRRATLHDVRSRRWRTDKTCRDDTDKIFRSHRSSRGNESDGSRRSSSEQTPDTADPVLILPETLVAAAAHMGSMAYVTARDMLNKLRSHTKEDSMKRRRVKLNA